MSAIVSKLRACLRGLDSRCAVTTAAGCYQLVLPADAWVDVEEARRALDEAEGHIRAGRTKAAWGPGNVAASIGARPFLASVDGEWIGQGDRRPRAHEDGPGVADPAGHLPFGQGHVQAAGTGHRVASGEVPAFG